MVGVGDSSSLVPTIHINNLTKVAELSKCYLVVLGKHLGKHFSEIHYFIPPYSVVI